jgi:uncharacterized protein (DUF488 family)
VTTLYTVGHSNRDLDAFLATLDEAGIQVLVDVRSLPQSRWDPFCQEPLADALEAAGIAYDHEPRLGGLRETSYREHMETDDWQEAFEAVLDRAREAPTAVMCAERDPASCHRRHIASAALDRGWEVVHLLGPGTEPQRAGFAGGTG